MTKVETETFEYESCDECSWCDGDIRMYWCNKKKRKLKTINGFPKWCPLEDKK